MDGAEEYLDEQANFVDKPFTARKPAFTYKIRSLTYKRAWDAERPTIFVAWTKINLSEKYGCSRARMPQADGLYATGSSCPLPTTRYFSPSSAPPSAATGNSIS